MLFWTRRNQFWEHQPKTFRLKSEKKLISFEIFQKAFSGWKCPPEHVVIIFTITSQTAEILNEIINSRISKKLLEMFLRKSV